MISKQSIETLKSHINIVDIISSYLELKKSGANFKACCPFHGEDTPSFVVSPTKEIYHCFGCHVGGDAIKFVQEYEKVSYPEALEKIADFYNFTLEYEKNANFKDYKALIECLRSFYQNSITEDVLNYLIERGITQESIEKFEIGFSPRGDKQIKLLDNNFLNKNDAIEIGLLGKQGDRIYARFSSRVMFPIRNHSGKLIAFGGRVLPNHKGDVAKYINSPDSKLFNKSRNFYGYHLAKEHIYKKGTMVITEGYLDVVMMHQAGIKTAVATLGTALTKDHIPIIKRGEVRVLLCYDGDKPGRAAAYKASVLLSQSEIDGGVVIFEEGKDPADMVKENKVEDLISIMKKPTSLIKYILDYIAAGYDLTNPYNKNKALKDIVDFLKSLNRIIASEYIGYSAKILGVGVEHITLGQTVIQKEPRLNTRANGLSKADEKFLKTLLEKPQYVELMFGNIDYEVYEGNKIFDSIMKDDLDNEVLIPLKIRDDIVVYESEDFIAACRLKQKAYLSTKLQELSNSTDPDVFLKMDKIQERIKKAS